MALAEQPERWIPEDTFATRLALVRVWLGGWNVAKVARHCSISPSSWASWERGASPHNIHDVCRKIVAATGCDYQWLLGGGPLRSTCSSPLTLVGGLPRQMELCFDLSAALALAG